MGLGFSWRGRAATKPVKGAFVRTAKIRRIPDNPRAIGMHNSPRIIADSADHHGSLREEPPMNADRRRYKFDRRASACICGYAAVFLESIIKAGRMSAAMSRRQPRRTVCP